MSVTKDDIKKVSHLARIKLNNEEVEELHNSLNGVLSFVEQLSEVDCSSVDDSVQYSVKLHERADVAVPTSPSVMDNAPQKECNMFVVPKMVN